jgi:hypothetical protein
MKSTRWNEVNPEPSLIFSTSLFHLSLFFSPQPNTTSLSSSFSSSQPNLVSSISSFHLSSFIFPLFYFLCLFVNDGESFYFSI